MNPLTNVRNITKLNERELSLGIEQKNSWHNMYSDSAWVFIGGLNYDLSEGDVITVFSQYGEIVNINLIRDQKTGKSKGFCFLCYEDQRSTVLAVDNLNGIKLLNRVIRVDHVSQYKIPKEHDDMDEVTRLLHSEGCAPKETLIKEEPEEVELQQKRNDSKTDKKHRKKRRRRSSSSDSSSNRPLNSRFGSKRIDKREDHRNSYKTKSSSDLKRHSDHKSRSHSKHKSKKDKNDSKY